MKQFLKITAGLILMTLGVAAAWICMRTGADFMDEPYEIMNALDPINTPLAPLTALLSNLAMRILGFDATVLNFRIMAYAVTVLSIAIACICFYRRSGKDSGATLMAGGAAMLLGGLSSAGWLYGWDIFSNCSLVAFATASWFYIRRPSVPMAAALGIVAATATLCRAPNAVTIGIALGLIYMLNVRRLAASLACAGAFLAVAIGVLLLIFGNFDNFFYSFRANMLGNHSIARMLFSTYNGAIRFTPPFACAVLFFLFVRYILGNCPRPKTAVALSMCAAVLLGLVYRLTLWHHGVFSSMYQSLVIALLLYPLLRKHAPRDTRILAFTALVAGFTGMAGSNTAFSKFVTVGMLPIALSVSWIDGSRAIRLWTVLMLCVIVCVGQSIRGLHSYFDYGFRVADTRIDRGPMRGLHTTARFAAYAGKADSLASDLRGQGYDIHVYGSDVNRFGWELTCCARNEAVRHEWNTEYLTASMRCDYYHSLNRLIRERSRNGKIAVIVPAPFKGFEQCTAFEEPDSATIAKLDRSMRRLPVPIEGVTVFVTP